MKNTLGRNVLEGFKPYVSSHEYKNHNRNSIVNKRKDGTRVRSKQ